MKKVQTDNHKVFSAISELIARGYVGGKLAEIVKGHTPPLAAKFETLDTHLNELARLAEGYRPSLDNSYSELRIIREELAQDPEYTLTRATRTVVIGMIFLIPIYALLSMLGRGKTFLVLNTHAERAEAAYRRRQLTLQASCLATIVVSIYCSVTANAVYDTVAGLF